MNGPLWLVTVYHFIDQLLSSSAKYSCAGILIGPKILFCLFVLNVVFLKANFSSQWLRSCATTKKYWWFCFQCTIQFMVPWFYIAETKIQCFFFFSTYFRMGRNDLLAEQFFLIHYSWPSFLRTWFLPNSSIYRTKSHGPFNLANNALIKYLYLTNLLLTNSSLHRTKIS